MCLSASPRSTKGHIGGIARRVKKKKEKKTFVPGNREQCGRRQSSCLLSKFIKMINFRCVTLCVELTPDSNSTCNENLTMLLLHVLHTFFSRLSKANIQRDFHCSCHMTNMRSQHQIKMLCRSKS